jgi:hypothetical protein
MTHSNAVPVSKIVRLALALGLLLLTLPVFNPQKAEAKDPCAPFPAVCHYTYDPVENCCNAAPWLDCYDVCF